MIEASSPSIDILMRLLQSEVLKFEVVTAFREEAAVLEYIWDNLEHQLVDIGVLERNYNHE